MDTSSLVPLSPPTYPNFPVDPNIVCDISAGFMLANDVPFDNSATMTKDDSYPPEISLASIPAALLDRGYVIPGRK
jgi:hypothetical protein